MSAIYNLSKGKHSFSAELFDFHHVWNAQYEGSHPLRQSLWKNESLAFLSYNYAFSPKLSLRSRVGVDWLQYRLHGSEKFSKLSPRVNLNLQYQLKGGMLLWSSSYNNYNYGMDLINQARIGLNPYLVQTGNPNLKSGCSMVEPFITVFTYIIGIRNFSQECNYKKRNKHRQCYIIANS